MYKPFDKRRLADCGVPKEDDFIFDVAETCTLIKHANPMILIIGYLYRQWIIFLDDKYNNKIMIRQHFYPKNNIRKRKEMQRTTQIEMENLPPQPHVPNSHVFFNNHCVFIEPEFTEPIATEPMKKVYKRRHNSVLKPIQSVILYQNDRKNKRNNDTSNFLLESRRKQICNIAQRSMSTVHR